MIYMRGQARDYNQWADITGDSTLALGPMFAVFQIA